MQFVKLGEELVEVAVIEPRYLFVANRLVYLLDEGEELDSVQKLTATLLRIRLRRGRLETLIYVAPCRHYVRIERTDFSQAPSKADRPRCRQLVDNPRGIPGMYRAGKTFYSGLPRKPLAV